MKLLTSITKGLDVIISVLIAVSGMILVVVGIPLAAIIISVLIILYNIIGCPAGIPVSDDVIIAHFYEREEQLAALVAHFKRVSPEDYYITDNDGNRTIGPKLIGFTSFIKDNPDWDIQDVNVFRDEVSFQMGPSVGWEMLCHNKSLVYRFDLIPDGAPYLVTGDTNRFLSDNEDTYDTPDYDGQSFYRRIEGHWYIEHEITTDVM